MAQRSNNISSAGRPPRSDDPRSDGNGHPRGRQGNLYDGGEELDRNYNNGYRNDGGP